MISITYIGAGVLLALTAWLFQMGVLTAFTQAVYWSVIFFVASSAGSAAYLTVSEVFPLEIRAVAISIFYACGTLVGGVAGPVWLKRLLALIAERSRWKSAAALLPRLRTNSAARSGAASLYS